MDTYSAAEAARRLGTSAPRVLRAIRRLGLEEPGRAAGSAVRLRPDQFARLAAELGDVRPPAGLSRSEAKVLAALARSPRGLASVRAVARRSGVSPTTAGHCLERLSRDGLATSATEIIAAGRARHARIFRANVTSPQWPQIAPRLARISLPAPGDTGDAGPAVTVPYYLRHLFWNTAPSQLKVASAAPNIARRLISVGDPDGLAWGVRFLPPEAWEHASRTRGLAPRSRQLARNIARRGRAAA